MKVSFIFILAIIVLLSLTGELEAKKFWKKVEKVGQNIRKASEKTLPIVQGYGRC
ncbi:cecropin-B2 [Diabrotica virgifera virgifera]|uniref:Cecropin-B2-like n=1 Tax=Diabrotica virgifera virgifera TaxID=50390 RepID=A0A6P7G7V0_DIAVI|nr:cecropin-B2 [Diabrotica virgifera virgifera]